MYYSSDSAKKRERERERESETRPSGGRESGSYSGTSSGTVYNSGHRKSVFVRVTQNDLEIREKFSFLYKHSNSLEISNREIGFGRRCEEPQLRRCPDLLLGRLTLKIQEKGTSRCRTGLYLHPQQVSEIKSLDRLM